MQLPTVNRHRFAELDALRAFAVTLVVWSHTVGRVISIGGYHIGGYQGVLLFFVISGFLITGILLDSRAQAAGRAVPWIGVLRAFYTRRFLRIFPIYYAVLFLAFGLGFSVVRAEFGWHLTYLSNWYFAYKGQFGYPTAHLWSLAVEEQFYLIWPWFALLVPLAGMPWIIGAMILIGPVSRLALSSAGVNDLAGWITTPTVLDALGLGCLLAYVWRHTKAADRVARWAVLVAVLIAVLHKAMTLLGIPAYALLEKTPLGWSLLCMWMVHQAARGLHGWLGKLLRAPPLVYLGTISYGIYVFHLFVAYVLRKLQHRFGFDFPGLAQGGLGEFVVVMLLCVASAALSWKFFERPINSLKDHFPYVRELRPATPGVQMPTP